MLLIIFHCQGKLCEHEELCKDQKGVKMKYLNLIICYLKNYKTSLRVPFAHGKNVTLNDKNTLYNLICKFWMFNKNC